MGPFLQGSFSHDGVERVDAQHCVGMLVLDGAQNGGKPFPFFLCANLLGSRSRALGTQIQDIRTFLQHAAGLRDGSIQGVVFATVVKGVGRHVQDAHDARFVKTLRRTGHEKRRGRGLHCNFRKVTWTPSLNTTNALQRARICSKEKP